MFNRDLSIRVTNVFKIGLPIILILVMTFLPVLGAEIVLTTAAQEPFHTSDQTGLRLDKVIVLTAVDPGISAAIYTP